MLHIAGKLNDPIVFLVTNIGSFVSHHVLVVIYTSEWDQLLLLVRRNNEQFLHRVQHHCYNK